MLTLTRAKVLLVEDDPREQNMVLSVAEQLKPAPEVDLVHNGKEALVYLDELTHDRLPQLVLLDLDLPMVHGLEVLRRIRKRYLTRGVPVTVFTGSLSAEDLAVAERYNASFVRKPILNDEYMDTLHKILHYWTVLNCTVTLPRD